MAIYANQVVEQYVNELLDTKLAVEGFCEVDDSLQANEGDTVKIYRYSDTGAAEVVAEGEGNTGYSDLTGEDYSYTVQTVQDRAKVTDEEQARNPFVADKKLDVVTAHIINKLRGDVVGQWLESTNRYDVVSEAGIPTFTELMTAIGNLDLGVDNGFNGIQEDVRIFCSPAAWRAFSVSLASNVLVEWEMINGIRRPIVNGIPVDITDLLADDTLDSHFLVATNKAVRLCKGKSVSAESQRTANIRTTEYYVRNVYVAALEFNTKVVKFVPASSHLTITITAPTHGTVTTSPASKAYAGDVVTITATPDEGYTAGTPTVTKTGGGSVTVTNGKFTMPNVAVTVACTFSS